jgi:hypothetical protein
VAMLLTPYRDLRLKIRRDFLAITIGAHVVYGSTLCSPLCRGPTARVSRRAADPPAHAVLAGAARRSASLPIAVAFHVQHARRSRSLRRPTSVAISTHAGTFSERSSWRAMWMLVARSRPGRRRLPLHIPRALTIAPGQASRQSPRHALARTGMRSGDRVSCARIPTYRAIARHRAAQPRSTHLGESTPARADRSRGAGLRARISMAAAGRCPPGERCRVRRGRASAAVTPWYAAQAPDDRRATET